jgi:hypothetical protein
MVFARLTLVCCAALLLAVPLAQARSAGQEGATVAPRLGFYNCQARTFMYWGSIQLRAGGRYVYGLSDASNRRFRTIFGSGTYRVSGTRITFRGGPMGRLYGVTSTANRFSLWAGGGRVYSYYCYRKV